MIAERMVYSPTAVAAAVVLSLALLTSSQQFSATIEGWLTAAPNCGDHNPLAASGHQPGWCL